MPCPQHRSGNFEFIKVAKTKVRNILIKKKNNNNNSVQHEVGL